MEFASNPLGQRAQKKPKTYNSRDSLVVTHPTTNRPACGLSTAERTGSPVLHTLWSYVLFLLQHPFILLRGPSTGRAKDIPERELRVVIAERTHQVRDTGSTGPGGG